MASTCRVVCGAFALALVCGGFWPADGARGAETKAVAVQAKPVVAQAKAPAAAKTRMAASLGRLPVVFEANKGQWDKRVRFAARAPGYAVFLGDSGADVALGVPAGPVALAAGGRGAAPIETLREANRRPRPQAILRMGFAGADPKARPAGVDPLAGKAHYYIGNDPKKWVTGVETFGRVRYAGLYPGIDLVFRGGRERPAFDFIVAPGSDPKPIRLSFNSAGGVRLEADGSLLINVGGVELRQPAPVAYQERAGRRVQIKGGYVLHGKTEVGFGVGAYDRSRPLVIDPWIVHSAYVAGGGVELLNGLAVGPDGTVVVTGATSSPRIPADESLPSMVLGGEYDAYVAKLTADLSGYVYVAYLGGSEAIAYSERGNAIAVDGAVNAYVAGFTSAPDFPIWRSLQNVLRGPSDAFVARLDAAGNMSFSTYLGGTANDGATGIAVDATGVYVAGTTGSSDLHLPGPIQSGNRGSSDGFVAKLKLDGSGLLHFNYLGGTDYDEINAIAVNGAGEAYVTGWTRSTDLAVTAGAPQAVLLGYANAFVAKLDASGATLRFLTYFGGGGTGIAVDAAGDAYVTGFVNSDDLQPTPGAAQRVFGGVGDAFVAKFAAGGNSVLYATYLGGNASDIAQAITVTEGGVAWVTGVTTSDTGFPLVDPVQGDLRGYIDAFVSAVAADGGSFPFSTYLGGSGFEWGYAIAAAAAGAIYVGGNTASLDFPPRDPLSGDSGGDGFVAKLAPPPPVLPNLTIFLGDSLSTQGGTPVTVESGQSVDLVVAVKNIGALAADGVAVTTSLPAGFALGPGSGICGDAAGMVTCSLGAVGVNVTRAFTLILVPTTPGVYSVDLSVAAADGRDSDDSDNRTSVSVTVTEPPPPGPLTLEVRKIVGPDPVRAGGPIAYKVGVRNAGTRAATGVTLIDTAEVGKVAILESVAPAGACAVAPDIQAPSVTFTCALGRLDPGQEATIIVMGRAERSGQVTNTATATANELEGAPPSTALVTDVVPPDADLAVQMSADSSTVSVGQSLVFRAVVRNRGPDRVSSARLTKTVDGAATLVYVQDISEDIRGARCARRPGQAQIIIDCAIAALNPGEAAEAVTIVAPVVAQTLVVTAVAAGDAADPRPENNRATAAATVRPASP